MKGTIYPDHIPRNKFKLIIQGLPPITFTKVAGLEEELDTVDLPDRTTASGGRTKPLEFTASMPTHHAVERNALEGWFQEGQDPVLPSYKKTGTLVKESLSRIQRVAYLLVGMYPSKRGTADMEMDNDGELDEIEWTFKADDCLPMA